MIEKEEEMEESKREKERRKKYFIKNKYLNKAKASLVSHGNYPNGHHFPLTIFNLAHMG
jgi:hypothetical protein